MQTVLHGQPCKDRGRRQTTAVTFAQKKQKQTTARLRHKRLSSRVTKPLTRRLASRGALYNNFSGDDGTPLHGTDRDENTRHNSNGGLRPLSLGPHDLVDKAVVP